MTAAPAGDSRIRKVVIVGGGTAGWMTAAALARALGPACEIRLIEPSAAEEDTGVLAPFESALPGLGAFNALLGIEEDALIRGTRAGFKLGTEFVDWSRPGRSYIHPLGEYGGALDGVPFHHHWLRLRREGATEALEAYSVAATAARLERFAPPRDDARLVLSTMTYALHLNATAYARGLRGYAEARGVRTVTAEVSGVERAERGLLTAVVLADGRRIEGELFIDCSGAAGLLINRALQAPFEDWRDWLPCDRLAWTETPAAESPSTLTRASARRSGWRWRVPLQGSTGHAAVFSSRFSGGGEDGARLLSDVTGGGEARLVKFTPGRRTAPWTGNCVAIGLSAACLEPLEATSLHLIQSAIGRLLALFPDRTFAAGEAEEFNRLSREELVRIRDLLIVHYKANRRRGEPLWDHCRAMPLPEPLAHKLRIWESRGRVPLYDEETFQEPDWVSVLVGQDVLPRRHHPFADQSPASELKARLARMRTLMREAVEAMPSHGAYLAQRVAGRP